MDKLLSSWSSTVKSLPENYVFPVDSRPGDAIVPFCNTLPMIDLETALARDRHAAVQQILEACQDFGFFQVINHGVDNDLVSDTMWVVKEFFDMSNEDKASVYSEDPSKKCRLYTSTYDYQNEEIHLWRDNLRHHCHPIDDFIHLWPRKPARYRDVVGKYSVEVGNLSSRILELICEGLGLGPGYFGGGLTGAQLFSANHYPPCPNPSLALGLPKHCDANLITFLLQDEIYGLQVYRHGEWLGVRPIPNAFVVILGHQAQIGVSATRRVRFCMWRFQRGEALRSLCHQKSNSIGDLHMEIKEDKDSRWFDVEFVPEDYIFSQEDRPRNLDIPVCDSIPVIDLAKATAANGHIQPVEAILMASQEFGFFQVINHGVPEKTVIDAMSVLKEFFNMPSKDRTGIVPHTKGWIYTSSTDYAKDGVHLWRENLKHPCHPLEECIQLWPDKPTRYQEVIAAYLVEIQKLSSRILEMICEGLGLKPGYFNDMSEVQLLSSNFYPPCPEPSLTLGILAHQDPSLITLLYQGNSAGLQVLKDGQWINVGGIPNAFVVNIGNQLEIISNGKLRSIKHRVVTSTHETRRSIATFVNPSPDCIIEPAKVLVNELEPLRYKASQYKEYVHRNKAFGDYTIALQNVMHSES